MMPPQPRQPESWDSLRPTDLRFSIANENIGSYDASLNHPSGKVRIVRYPTPSSEALLLRQQLLTCGLILGEPQTEPGEPEQAFIIPPSARPLGYDAGQHFEGTFTYADRQMFYDLGKMFAVLSHLKIHPLVLQGDIGRLVAIVEFRRPNERHLYFIPGVELMVKPISEHTTPLEYYTQRLEQQFGQRFSEVTRHFSEGYCADQSREDAPDEDRW